jgi:hypothetical protein
VVDDADKPDEVPFVPVQSVPPARPFNPAIFEEAADRVKQAA